MFRLKVLLRTSEGLTFEGWVYTIDPVTHNWVLINNSGTSTPTMHIVMNAAVMSTDVTDETCPDSVRDAMNSCEEVTAKVRLHQ